MQNYRDYYAILGIARDATAEEIKQVYRRLARQYHPDMNQGNKEAEEKFKDIGEAYAVLSDLEKRAEYDQYSRYWNRKSFPGRTPRAAKMWETKERTATDNFDYGQFEDFNNFLDQLLGRRKESRVATASDVASRTSVATPDPFRPGTTKVSYTVPSRPNRRDIEARLILPLEKAYIGGSQRIRLEDGRSIEVNMPPAMLDEQRIRLRGQGIDGGDLFLKITVEPHPFYKIEGIDLLCQVPVTPSEAVLGGQIEIPTLDGRVKITIPPGVRSGQRLRLANKGYPDENGRRGDQLVEIQIVVPKNLSLRERELYEKLRQIETFNPRLDLPV
jgi:curved DNA-binding protein